MDRDVLVQRMAERAGPMREALHVLAEDVAQAKVEAAVAPLLVRIEALERRVAELEDRDGKAVSVE